MSETFYKKVGKRYVPISEFDSDFSNSFTKGAHLIISKPGVSIYRRNVETDFIGLIAAGIYMEEELSRLIVQKAQARPQQKELTSEQLEAWQKLKDTFEGGLSYIVYPSAQEIARECVKELVKQAVSINESDLDENQNVKDAFEYFRTICALSKTSKE